MSGWHCTDRTRLLERRTARPREAGRGIPCLALGSHEPQGVRGRWAGWEGGETAVETAASSGVEGYQYVQGKVIPSSPFFFFFSECRRWSDGNACGRNTLTTQRGFGGDVSCRVV